MKTTQHSGSDKKPSMLETATAKIDMAESSVAQSQIPEELWLGQEVLATMAGKTYG